MSKENKTIDESVNSVKGNETETKEIERTEIGTIKSISGKQKGDVYRGGVGVVLSTFADSIPVLFAKHIENYLNTTSDCSEKSLVSRLYDLTKDGEGNPFKTFYGRVLLETDFVEDENKGIKKTGFNMCEGLKYVTYTRPVTYKDFFGSNNVMSETFGYLYSIDKETRRVAHEQDKQKREEEKKGIETLKNAGIDLTKLTPELLAKIAELTK